MGLILIIRLAILVKDVIMMSGATDFDVLKKWRDLYGNSNRIIGLTCNRGIDHFQYA